MLGLGIGVSLTSPPPVRAGAVAGYDVDAQALFARFDIEPTAERKRLISDRFVAGKATTWWAKLDALWVHAAHGAEAGRLNWLGNRYNCLPVNDPTFTVDRGYAGDGVTSYLDTQFNPVTAVESKYTLNSGAFGLRSNTNNQANGSLAGYWDGAKGSTLNPWGGNNRINGRVNQNALSESENNAASTSIGMFAVSRTASNAVVIYRDGTAMVTSSVAATSLANGSFRLGAISDSSLRSCQFSMGFIGGGLTAAEMASLFEWFQPYKQAVGIG